MRSQGFMGGSIALGTPESEGLWDSMFQDAAGGGDNEHPVTGATILAEQTSGNPSLVALGNAQEGNIGPLTPGGAEAVSGALTNTAGNILGSAEFLTSILPLLILVAVAVVVVVVVKD